MTIKCVYIKYIPTIFFYLITYINIKTTAGIP